MIKGITYKKAFLSILAFLFAVVLLWLTVSLPFVYEAKKQLTEKTTSKEKNANNSLAGTTEEKVPSNPNLTINEEYLHNDGYDFSITELQKDIAYLHLHEGTYIAFHAELHAPPPNTIS
ncbi:hypothetical protein [Niabella ginsenosidivorans]|uniref:hypothetical protein n=1 Tax=Niabella ginsenosidivorans TaxID=1176587 RepID=UPI001FE00031|nr:hypothetical protein [Niabella ginsenosidivorans]